MKTILVVDVQNDFCKGGALAVPGANPRWVAACHQYLFEQLAQGANLIFTQDSHPRNHMSFASNNGVPPFTVNDKDDTLWPDHCIIGTHGWEFAGDLKVLSNRADLIIRKGMNPAVDSYSALYDNADRSTGLAGYLHEILPIMEQNVEVLGLALDYCVSWTARDLSIDGFNVTIKEEFALAIGDAAAAKKELMIQDEVVFV